MTSQLPAAVLFDCDGVLVDTERTASRVLAGCLAEIGVEVEFEALRQKITGTSLATAEAMCAELYGGPLPAGWFAGFVTYRLEVFRQGVDPIPGAIEAVRAVQSAGVRLAVVSQGAHEKMAITLPSSGLAEVLGDAPLFSGQDVTRGKPHPDLYLHAAASVGVDPADCVVVEDSPTGATAAAAAGMRVLGYAVDADHERMRATGAELFFDLREVPTLVGLPASAG
ncbi:MAG: HAD family phosphatase [Solirubrobacteraceae bacterium]|nr:HAD family phosphatase [Solirubrobacteraceae bacterium]